MSDNAVFSLDEVSVFKSNEKIRQRMIASIVEKDIPDDTEKLTVLLRTVDSSDAIMLKKANVKIKDASNKVTNAASDLVSRILLGVNASPPIRTVKEPISLPDNMERVETVPGETEIGVVNVDFEDFKKD